MQLTLKYSGKNSISSVNRFSKGITVNVNLPPLTHCRHLFKKWTFIRFFLSHLFGFMVLDTLPTVLNFFFLGSYTVF